MKLIINDFELDFETENNNLIVNVYEKETQKTKLIKTLKYSFKTLYTLSLIDSANKQGKKTSANELIKLDTKKVFNSVRGVIASLYVKTNEYEKHPFYTIDLTPNNETKKLDKHYLLNEYGNLLLQQATQKGIQF